MPLLQLRLIVLLLSWGFAQAATSEFWGTNSTEWKNAGGASSRISDFSFAGYDYGNSEPPKRPTTIEATSWLSVGKSNEVVSKVFIDEDQTANLQAALDALSPGDALLIPEGTYRLDYPLFLRTSNVTIRGAGTGKTILKLSQSLYEAYGQEGTCKAKNSKGYGWCEGFFKIESRDSDYTSIASIDEPAMRGDTTFVVSTASILEVGMDIIVSMTDDSNQTMFSYLTGGEFPPSPDRRPLKTRSFCARIESISGVTVTINRPLAFDIRPEWSPKLLRAGKTVEYVGLEDLTFEFPSTPGYSGHHKEWGYNAIEFSNTYNSWIKRIQIINADLGIKIGNSYQCEVSDITFGPNTRDPDSWNYFDGHHGVDLSFSSSMLVRNLNFIRYSFVHDITVMMGFLNVITTSYFTALSADHHGIAPSWNLWDNLRTDSLDRLYASGGAPQVLPHSGRGEVFWNVRQVSPDGTEKFISHLPQPKDHTGNANTWFGLLITPFAITPTKDISLISGHHYSYLLEKLDSVVEPDSLYYAQLHLRLPEKAIVIPYFPVPHYATEDIEGYVKLTSLPIDEDDSEDYDIYNLDRDIDEAGYANILFPTQAPDRNLRRA